MVLTIAQRVIFGDVRRDLFGIREAPSPSGA
jgi:hypothetical protein